MDEQAPEVTQVAVVVADLDAALEAYHRILGWGPWRVYDFDRLPHTGTTVRGEPAEYSMRTAVTRVGGVDFELVEPGPGASPYREFLQRHGPGLHHVMCRSTDGDGAAVSDRLAAAGLPLLFGGSVAGVLDYAYHDGTAQLGVLVETVRYGRPRRPLEPTRTYPA
jgi:methylmalonyl-CoA/ethylmalonyl-CoA epimerase